MNAQEHNGARDRGRRKARQRLPTAAFCPAGCLLLRRSPVPRHRPSAGGPAGAGGGRGRVEFIRQRGKFPAPADVLFQSHGLLLMQVELRIGDLDLSLTKGEEEIAV